MWRQTEFSYMSISPQPTLSRATCLHARGISEEVRYRLGCRSADVCWIVSYRLLSHVRWETLPRSAGTMHRQRKRARLGEAVAFQLISVRRSIPPHTCNRGYGVILGGRNS